MFCNVWMCVYVSVLTIVWVGVCMCGFCNVCVCMCGFCNVCVCVYVCGFCYVWVCVCVGVLTIVWVFW